jgi:hypothetical protein
MSKTLATVQAGPTLRVWWDGVEIARVDLDAPAALALASALLREARASMIAGPRIEKFDD